MNDKLSLYGLQLKLFPCQQVHTDFKRQFLDLTVDKLLEQFVLNKYTGLEKPGKSAKLRRVCLGNAS